jgi:hypothetical protein
VVLRLLVLGTLLRGLLLRRLVLRLRLLVLVLVAQLLWVAQLRWVVLRLLLWVVLVTLLRPLVLLLLDCSTGKSTDLLGLPRNGYNYMDCRYNVCGSNLRVHSSCCLYRCGVRCVVDVVESLIARQADSQQPARQQSDSCTIAQVILPKYGISAD